MNILISTLSQTPIYEQIREQFKEMVLTGKLKSGEQLPSIRILSKDLKVGVVTVKRAYEELEKEGIVIILQGRGCFVAEIDAEKIKKIHLDILSKRLHEIKDFSSIAGISKEEVIRVLNKVYGGGNDDH